MGIRGGICPTAPVVTQGRNILCFGGTALRAGVCGLTCLDTGRFCGFYTLVPGMGGMRRLDDIDLEAGGAIFITDSNGDFSGFGGTRTGDPVFLCGNACFFPKFCLLLRFSVVK